MKRYLHLTVITMIFIVLSGCSRDQKEDREPDSINILLEQIADPPAEYRTAPLWDWNEKINKEDIKFQMEQFKKGGLGGVFIHPRPGLVTEYLSDEWNEIYKYTVETGKKLGMYVWIYDENSYPSGFAGGHVQDRFPESYNQGTGLGFIKTTDLNDTTGLPVEAVLQSYPEMEYYIFYRTYPKESWWYGGFPYVDLLFPGVTDTFMAATMEGYEEYIGEEFGKTVPGIFTDEPNLPAAKGPGTAFRWTPDLFDRFEERWGYRLQDNLISMVEEHGEWNKVRHNYHELMLELFLDRWAVPWNKYCEENNMIWTGHYWEHGWPIPGEGYDEAAFYMYHQMPGVDMLGRQLCEDGMCQQFGNIRAVRELASAANQSGARRRFSETYGGAGWQVSFQDLKRLVDWEVVLGVNFVNQHLSYFSMQGVRKFDYPPSFSYQEPWWDKHKLLGDYTARISLALSAGEQINDVLIIQPNTTSWMYHTDTHWHTEINDLSVTFKEFLGKIEASQLEYDLGSEQVLKRFGQMSEEGLKVGERTYSRIILPPGMRNIDSSTNELLKQFTEAGYDLLVLSDSVDHLDGSAQDEKIFPASEETVMAGWFGQDDCIIKTLSGDPGLVFHQRRRLDNAELIFIVNSSATEEANLKIALKAKNLAEIDLLTGELLPIETNKEGDMINSDISLSPVGSRLLISSRKKLIKSPGGSVEETVIESGGETRVTRLANNLLTIDYLDVETADYVQEDVYFMNAMYKLFEWTGLPTGNPWQHKIQFKKTYLEMDDFGESSWHKVHYSFEIDKSLTAEQFKSLRLVAERPEVWTVLINGLEVHAIPGEWWLDRHFPVYNIGGSCHPGTNTITLSANKMSVFAEIMPIYVLGDFSLAESEKGFIIQAPENMNFGMWTDFGMPFYGDRVEYNKTFNLDMPARNESIVFRGGDWQGIVGEVFVNGNPAGTVGWQAEIDITDLVEGGENEISFIVCGSLKNPLGFHHRDVIGWIDGPFSWNEAPANQPPGGNYRFMDYGLEKPFMIIKRVNN